MSNTYSFLHTVATQTPAIRSLHDLSVYHHQLWEIVLIGFFTLMATLAWYIFVKRSANKELGRRGALWRAFWQASSPAIITIIGIISASLLLRVIARDFIPELLDWIAPLRLIAIASLCMFGIVGQVVTDVPAAMQRRPAQTLADALPNVATWWVPEHPISFGLVIGLGVLGFFLSIKGKRVDFHPEVTH